MKHLKKHPKTLGKLRKSLDMYYRNLHAKNVVETIVRGGWHSRDRMVEYIEKFSDDRRKGKIK